MKQYVYHSLLSIVAALVICCGAAVTPTASLAAEEAYPGQGKDQLVDALDAAIARVLDSGRWREIINSDPVAGMVLTRPDTRSTSGERYRASTRPASRKLADFASA